jgi:hypothetical protein
VPEEVVITMFSANTARRATELLTPW